MATKKKKRPFVKSGAQSGSAIGGVSRKKSFLDTLPGRRPNRPWRRGAESGVGLQKSTTRSVPRTLSVALRRQVRGSDVNLRALALASVHSPPQFKAHVARAGRRGPLLVDRTRVYIEKVCKDRDIRKRVLLANGKGKSGGAAGPYHRTDRSKIKCN